MDSVKRILSERKKMDLGKEKCINLKERRAVYSTERKEENNKGVQL